ncbi:MAG: hypothetical protein ACTTKL_11610 [Treponema sp.]
MGNFAVGKMCSPAAFFMRRQGKLYFPMANYLTRDVQRRRADELRNKFAVDKLGQTAKPIITFMLNKCSLQEMSAGVQQINNAVQEVNDLARKNKDNIEGLAEEVGKFKV